MERILNRKVTKEIEAVYEALLNYEMAEGIPQPDLWLIAMHIYHHLDEADQGYHTIVGEYGDGLNPMIHEFLLLYNRTTGNDVATHIWAARDELTKYEQFEEPRRLREIVGGSIGQFEKESALPVVQAFSKPCPICNHKHWAKLGNLHCCSSCSYVLY
jgi:hypothetical protein